MGDSNGVNSGHIVIEKALNGLLIPPLIDLVKEYLPIYRFRAGWWMDGKWDFQTTQNQLKLYCKKTDETIDLDETSSHFFPPGKLTVNFGEFDALLWKEHGFNLGYAMAHYEFTLFKVTCTVGARKYTFPILNWTSNE